MTTLLTRQDLDHDWPPDLDWQDLPPDPNDTGFDPVTSMGFDLNRHERSIQLLEASAGEYCDEIYTLKRELHELTEALLELTARALAQDVVDAPF
jgi:hypothetical protein